MIEDGWNLFLIKWTLKKKHKNNMSQKVYTIDAIEGNSNLGVPVFSNYGKM